MCQFMRCCNVSLTINCVYLCNVYLKRPLSERPALSTVRHQKRDFGLAKMTKRSARWPLIVRRVPSKGREFKPQPGRSGGQYPIWWISQWSIYTCIYIRKSMLRISISITECLDMSHIFVIFPCISRIKSTGSGSRLKRKWRNDSLLYLTCFC